MLATVYIEIFMHFLAGQRLLLYTQCELKALKKISLFRSGDQRVEAVHFLFSSSLHSAVTEVIFDRFLFKMRLVHYLVRSA